MGSNGVFSDSDIAIFPIEGGAIVEHDRTRSRILKDEIRSLVQLIAPSVLPSVMVNGAFELVQTLQRIIIVPKATADANRR